jgi:hypothetical protein
MKRTIALTVTSLLTIILSMTHLADDIVHGLAPGRFSNITVVVVLAVWLYATIELIDRRTGLVVILVMSLLAAGLPVIHMSGASGLTAGMKSWPGFFFAWTLLAVGVTALFSVILSARGLWSLRRTHRT